MKNSVLTEDLFFSMTWNFLNVFLPSQHQDSPETAKSYEDALTIFRRYITDKRNISIERFRFIDLTYDFLLDYREFLTAEGYKPNTINHRLAVIMAYMKYIRSTALVISGTETIGDSIVSAAILLNIAIYCVRYVNIRPFATARKVWLFCNTIDGAKATAILYTLVETAKANDVDPYYYLKYLLDSMPSHMDDHDRSFLADMMPWSKAFKEYAAKEKADLIQKYRLNASDEPPKQTRCRSGPNKETSA